jgi:hypothetical protein
MLALALTWPRQAGAVDGCKASVRSKDGVVLVSAKHVTGTLLWGYSAGAETHAFSDATCFSTGKAKGCQLGTGDVASTPPAQCTVYLADASGTCSTRVKACTPGLRRQDPPFYERFTTGPIDPGCSGASLGQCTVGEVRLFAGHCLPAGYQYAHGQVQAIGLNTVLYLVIGDRYGGDGINTIALPDLSGLEPGGVHYIICTSGLFP